jgi:hypothetical protein
VELVVAAGRIPAEWSALWEDAELFREVHALAGGRRSGPIGVTRSPKSRPVTPPEIPPRERFSEELL